MKIFVTGGAGYVGSHAVRALCNAGHEVVVFDNLSKGHAQAVDDRASLVIGDLSDTQILEDTLMGQGFDGVMHFAAYADVNESVQNPGLYYENNVVNSVRLLAAMQRAEINRLVFSSTCATYGEPEKCPITEDIPQNPINPYGRTKLAMEWAMRDAADAWGLGATALRYFNASGAAEDGTIGEDHDPETHLIPIVLQVALGQRDGVKIFGIDYPTPDGTCVRDYIHVDDLASAHVLAIESQPAATFRSYNVGTGQGTSVREIIEAARAVTGHPIPADNAPRRDGDPPSLYANPSKIKTELHWSPQHTNIKTIIESAWRWHASNQCGFPQRSSDVGQVQLDAALADRF